MIVEHGFYIALLHTENHLVYVLVGMSISDETVNQVEDAHLISTKGTCLIPEKKEGTSVCNKIVTFCIWENVYFADRVY